MLSSLFSEESCTISCLSFFSVSISSLIESDSEPELLLFELAKWNLDSFLLELSVLLNLTLDELNPMSKLDFYFESVFISFAYFGKLAFKCLSSESIMSILSIEPLELLCSKLLRVSD